MNQYYDKFESLKEETNLYFYAEFDTEEDETEENVRIKTEILKLIKNVENNETNEFYSELKKNVIEYLCEICGHNEDLEILKNNSPSILSAEEIEYIIQNSALSRWF